MRVIVRNVVGNNVMNVKGAAVLLSGLAAMTTHLVTMPDFLRPLLPEGQVNQVMGRLSGDLPHIAGHPFSSNPVISAFRRAKAAAVSLDQVMAFWVFALSQWLLLTLGHESGEFLTFSLRNAESDKVLSHGFGVNSKPLGYLPNTHLLIPVKVMEERFQYRIQRDAALGVPVTLAGAESNLPFPVGGGIARLLEEDLAAVFTRLARLLHFDTSRTENEASRFGHSAGVKRTDAKRDAVGLYRGWRGMLFDCALDRVKFSTSGLA